VLTNIFCSFNTHREQLLADDINILARRLPHDYHSFSQRTDGDGNALFNRYQSKVMKGKLRPPPCPTPDKIESDTEDGNGSESFAREKKER